MDSDRSHTIARSVLAIALWVVFSSAPSRALCQGAIIESRGAAAYSVPIVIPPGPAGHQPDVALVYDSGDGKGAAGPVGFGWSISADSRIERETRAGSPYDFDNLSCGALPCYRSDFVLDGQDLICDSGSCATCTSGSPCRYRTQSEDGRIIEYLGSNGWKIRDRDGRTLLYGASMTNRLANPETAQVFSWQIESATDVNANWIAYEYDTASSMNVAYLKKITYAQNGAAANRSIEFILNSPSTTPRPDQPVNARPGFRQQTDRRVAQIDVRAAGSALVARYVLEYSQDPDSLRSRLWQVQRLGSDGSSSVPPYVFTYTERAPGDGFKGAPESSFGYSATSCPPFGGIGAYNSFGQLVLNTLDVNRDGVVDLYRVLNFTHATVTAEVAYGTTTRFLPGPGQNCLTEVRGTPFATGSFPAYDPQHPGDRGVLDIDGDGFPDFVEPTAIRRGTGETFLSPIGTSLSSPQGDFNFDWEYADSALVRLESADSHSNTRVHAALLDVTGDGRPDLVASNAAGQPYASDYEATAWAAWTGWAVFPNRGLKSEGGVPYIDFGLAPFRWSAPSGAFIESASIGVYGTAVTLDVNGDGLADRLTRDRIAYGHGAGFLGEQETPWTTLGFNPGYTRAGFFDLNGDGFLDRLEAVDEGQNHWDVRWGTGNGFRVEVSSFAAPFPGHTSDLAIESVGLAVPAASLRDVNADGLPDRVQAGVYLNNGPTPGLLKRAVDPLGGVIEFSYRAASNFQGSNGLPANPNFPLAKPLVIQVVRGDGRAATPTITTNFMYSGGVFDFAEKEFRGFASVVATEIEAGVEGTQTTTTYRSDRVCGANRATRQATRAGVVLRRETMTYLTVSTGSVPNQWGKCLPESLLVENVEGSEAEKKVSRTVWDYGTPVNAYYNLAKVTEYGEWNPTTQTNVGSDERVTEFSYYSAIPSSSWPGLVSRVKTATVKDLAGNVYSRRTYCYQGTTCPDAVNKGVVAQIRDELTDYTENPPIIGATKTIASYSYDGYGNPVQIVGAATSDDPNGLRTTIEYDPTYQTFPTLVSVGSDVTAPLTPLDTRYAYTGCAGGLNPPPALGLPCQTTRPDRKIESTGYDALGRVARVEQPGGYIETRSYAMPTTGTPGQTTLQANVTADGAVLVSRTFVDGLGRTFREESPGKLSETIVVTRTYDDRGRLAAESLPLFLGASPYLRTYAYDGLGRIAQVTDVDGVTKQRLSYLPWKTVHETYEGALTPGNRKQYTENSVDGLGRLVRVAQFVDAGNGASSTPYVVTAKYDALDQLYEVRDPIANDSSLCAALNMGPTCAAQDHVTEVTWDTFGRRVKIDDPDSGVWRYRYDDAGLLKERTQHPGSGSARTQLFVYDALQRVSSRTFTPTGSGVADATFVYDNAYGGTGDNDYTKLIQINSTIARYDYGHDVAGRTDAVIQRTAGRRFDTAVVYDEIGRVKRKAFPDDEEFVFTYDGTRLASIAADSANPAFTGKVLKLAQYDAMGRLQSVQIGESGSSPVATVAYTFSPLHQRLTRVLGTPGVLLANDSDGDRLVTGTDKCPYAYDTGNADTGGLGSSSGPDGIGNACQCGDVDGSGRVTNDDSTWIAFYTLGTPLARPELCDVNGDSLCDTTDSTLVSNAAASGSGNLQQCRPSEPANVPSSQPLDLTVAFDGLGRLTSQTGMLGSEAVNRSYTYDGLSRLATATGPWEKATGGPTSVTWSYTYDALGNLRTQTSSRTPASAADSRTWSYGHATKPHFLTSFAQQNQPTETLAATLGGEVSSVARPSLPTDALTWNAIGKLYRYKDSTYSYDVFGELAQTVAGPSGSQSTIVSVGDDFEVDLTNARANKFFSVGGVRIASLATSYTAPTASLPPAVWRTWRGVEPLVPPAVALATLLGLVGVGSLTLRRRTPVWLSAPGVGVLAFVLISLPSRAFAATLTTGPGKYGRHAEPFLAYLPDHLGTVRAVVNRDGIVVETRDYAPFGESIAKAGVFAVQHRFTGQPQDDQAGGLSNYGARFYNAKWGRFASPDEMVQGFDSQGLNPFTYVLNRPTSATDPTGHYIWNGVSIGAWSSSTIERARAGDKGFDNVKARGSDAALASMGIPPSGSLHLAATDAEKDAEIKAELERLGVDTSGWNAGGTDPSARPRSETAAGDSSVWGDYSGGEIGTANEWVRVNFPEVAGSSPRAIVGFEGPAWSPDGAWIRGLDVILIKKFPDAGSEYRLAYSVSNLCHEYVHRSDPSLPEKEVEKRGKVMFQRFVEQVLQERLKGLGR